MKSAVIIVNWNGGDLLSRAVQSVLDQVCAAHRVLVIDNASTDNSLAAVSDLDARVEIYKMERNLGFAAANNWAIELVNDCDWVALLNPDAIASPQWLAELEKAVQRYPGTWSFASRMMSMDFPDLLDGAGDCYHISGLVWRRYHGMKLSSVDAISDATVFGPCGGAAYYHRESYLRIGGFDEDFFCYCEDVDLAFRMQLRGMETRYIYSAVVSHKGGGTTGGDNRFSDYYGHRNLVWVWVKNMPLSLLIILMPLHLGVVLLVIIQKLIQGRGKTVLRAKADALFGVPQHWRKRKAIMRERRCSLLGLLLVMSKSILPRR